MRLLGNLRWNSLHLSLDKELQKQNRNVLDQSKQASEEETKKRQELSDRFNDTIKDVQGKISNQEEERQKQVEENTKLREQLQNFLNQYEVRDKHFEHQLHAKDLEVQLAPRARRLQPQTSAAGSQPPSPLPVLLPL